MLVVGNLEAQFRSPVLTERLRLALFTDGGQVWNRGGNATIRLQTFRVTPGVGLRALTPIGVIRVDLGYNGYESEPGAAYYYAPATGGGTPPLYCVSPGNRFSPNRPEEGSCPATFRPTGRKTFLGRLNPSLWIGQAF
jgi:outer membrane protein insertion porin family/translocation and assembly module TamA